nr:MAG TPA: hypothetical protein [Bacteriophage sp.]
MAKNVRTKLNKNWRVSQRTNPSHNHVKTKILTPTKVRKISLDVWKIGKN